MPLQKRGNLGRAQPIFLVHPKEFLYIVGSFAVASRSCYQKGSPITEGKMLFIRQKAEANALGGPGALFDKCTNALRKAALRAELPACQNIDLAQLQARLAFCYKPFPRSLKKLKVVFGDYSPAKFHISKMSYFSVKQSKIAHFLQFTSLTHPAVMCQIAPLFPH